MNRSVAPSSAVLLLVRRVRAEEEGAYLVLDPALLAHHDVPSSLQHDRPGPGDPAGRVAHYGSRSVGVVFHADQQYRHLELLDREVGPAEDGVPDVLGEPGVASARGEEPINEFFALLRREVALH